jgi:hypothetical protein
MILLHESWYTINSHLRNLDPSVFADSACELQVSSVQARSEHVRQRHIHGIICTEIVAHSEHAFQERNVRETLEWKILVEAKGHRRPVGVR